MIERPEKVFPCACCCEGLLISTFETTDSDQVVAVTRDGELEDEYNYYTLGIAFWGAGSYNDGRLSWWDRLRLMWYVWKHGHPWCDMVDMRPQVAKNFANHILYRVDQMQAKIDHKKDELRKTEK